MRGGKNVRDAAALPIAVLADQKRRVGESLGEIRIMQGNDHGGPCIGAYAQQLQRLELVVRIELVGGFVQQEETRCLRQYGGQ